MKHYFSVAIHPLVCMYSKRNPINECKCKACFFFPDYAIENVLLLQLINLMTTGQGSMVMLTGLLFSVAGNTWATLEISSERRVYNILLPVTPNSSQDNR